MVDAADAVVADAVVAGAAADAAAADAAVLAVAADGDTENHPRAFLPAPAWYLAKARRG